MTRFQRQAQRHPRLAQRARRQGRIATGPDRRAAQRQIGHIRSQSGKQIKNIQRKGRGAARSAIRTTNREADFERGLAQNLKGVATPGLVRRQLKVGAQAVEQYGQGLASISRKAARQDVRGVKQQRREDIYNTKESVQGIQHQATAQTLASLVQSKRQAQRDAAQQQQQDMLDKIKAQRERQRGHLQDAYSAVGTMLETKVPANDHEWGLFRAAVQQTNPLMSPHAIENAINRYRTTQLRQQGPDVIDYWRRVLGL